MRRLLYTLRPLLLMVTALTLGLASVSVSRAATHTVGDGTPVSCTQNTLRTAVNAAVDAGGGTITFNCGGDPHTILLGQQLRFDEPGDYLLDGGNLITLDGQEQTRLLYTASGGGIDLTVQNISLMNGRAFFDAEGERAANQGGAIYSGYNNALTVTNVYFENNRAKGDRHPYHGGGAIAIDTTSRVTISDSTFVDNRAPNGGAINNLLSILKIERSVFRENVANRDDPGGGGAIYNDAGQLTILDSHILDNTSANLGGGIFSWAHNVNGSYSGKTVIKRTVIDGNHAEHGGGLWKGGYYVLELRDSSVTNNTALTRGAGISGTGPGKNFNVINTTIAYNTVQQTGSAAGVFSANASSTLTNVTLAYNTVPFDPSSVGAAIHGNVTVKNTIFVGNTGGWNNIWSCLGTITNGGGNVQTPGTTCGAGIPVHDPALAGGLVPPLGAVTLGQTQFLPLTLASTAAINKGINCPGADQRGVARPQGDACDSGAYELEGSVPGAPTISAPLNDATGIATQPVILFTDGGGTDKFKLSIKRADGTAVIKATLMLAEANCAPTCSYDVADSGKSLKAGKPYTLVIKAVNVFGQAKSKVKFRT